MENHAFYSYDIYGHRSMHLLNSNTARRIELRY